MAHKSKPERKRSASIFVPQKPPDGLRFHVDLSVTMAELRSWHPMRIAAYFRGIAEMLRAVHGVGP